VTASGSGAPGRETTTDGAPGRGIGRQILVLALIGLVFRLIMAYGIEGLRGSGFDADLGLFRYWANVLAQYGPSGFYANASYADYTPGYLYALWPVGIVGGWLGGVADLIKLPAILTDVALGIVVYLMARDLGVSERRSWLAGAVVIFNPISWFDSVIWGQVDSFGTVFLLLAVRELWRNRTERAAILAVVAALIKPQLAILVPIIAVVTIRRALWPDGGFGSERAPEPSGLGWERRITGPIRILTTGVVGFLTAVVIAAPFGLSVISISGTAPFLDSSLLRLVLSTAATYPYVSVNAYNLWALFPVDGRSMASSGLWSYDAPVPDASSWAALGPLPAGLVGAALLLGLALVVSLLVARRPDRLTILVGVCALAIAFFAVPTRVHERYLFPLFGLAAILIAFSWRWRIAYLLASVATFLNMYVVLTTIYPDNPGVSDWFGIGGTIRSFWGVAVIAVLHTLVLAWILVQLRGGARHGLEAELEDGRSVEPAGDGWAVHQRVLAPQAAGGGDARPGSTTGPPAARPAAGSLVPAWFDRPSWSDLGLLAWLRARITDTPVRPDRTATLAREGRGHLDRLDLWLLIVLVVAALCLRTFRLAEPARMHFDEVYHARTAAEFLQDWRYGLEHEIYEWTHPHLAKYAIAAGIVLFAGHDVAASSQLGTPVLDAAVEPRRPDPQSPAARDGERAWVVTGSAVMAYDLATRKLVVELPVPGADAVAFDAATDELLVGTDSGGLWTLDLTGLDGVGGFAPDQAPVEPVQVATLDGAISRIAPFDDGQHVGALLPDGRVAIVDEATGEVAEATGIAGAVDLTAAGSSDAVIATPPDVTDPAAVAAQLATVLGGDAAGYEAALRRSDADQVLIEAPLTTDVRTALQAAIDGGSLPGIAIGPVPVLAVADPAGVDLVTTSATVAASVALTGGAAGVAMVSGIEDGNQLYATTTDAATGDPQVAIVALSGRDATSGPTVSLTMPLPGAGSRVLFDDAAGLVEVMGDTADGDGTTVYVIEPHGHTVFADHRLPFTPSAWALDHNADYPTANRGALLVFDAQGATASLDVGHYPFAWRLPGVILGALTVGLLFLLTRILFRRRTIAVLAGLFALLDGMFFVQSRIAMNDVYTGFFILAAYALFAWLWIDQRRPRWAFWTLMPVVGVLLGLGLASKWVAAYAIGALGLLILARSALGRLLLIATMVGLTAVLGWIAMAVPVGSDASGNVTFTLIMVMLTLAAVVVTIHHPIAWSDEEMWLAIGGPPVLGLLVFLGALALGRADSSIALGPVALSPQTAGFGLVVAGLLAYAAFQVGARLGIGPHARRLAPDPDHLGLEPPAPPPEGWLRLGSGLGLPIAWMIGSLIAIPLAVYVISYLPWAFIENHQLWPGWPPGHTGQTLLDLTGQMYNYHNNLAVAHAANSPWWAWPFNLKPVWFYQGGFASSTAASIYDAGNMVIWWLGVPATAFVAYQAFRRRSLALGLILVAFLAQWISWARIDRPAFQYHYYTSLPFVVMALAYFVAELWHGASRRTWLLARAAAAVAVVGPVILWILRLPLCTLANVEAVDANSAACNGNPGNLVVTPSVAALVVIAVVTLILLGRQLSELGRPRADGRPLALADLMPLVLTAIGGGVLLALSRVLPSDTPLLSMPGIVPEVIALVIAIPLLLIALQLLMARDARRFVVGTVAVAAGWFAILYPNIAALPLPSALVNAYQGLLPTYLYAFQFSVNTTQRTGSTSFADPWFAVFIAFLLIACAVIAYAAWVWRLALAEEAASEQASGSDSATGVTGVL
jgi:Dolichyl-phosphate-mannose-protein mannosyltransferase/C-terminal four TMM region of protein-O-mannosyltransferase/Glycosyltransferase family 87